jgi:hypothetical protein
LGVPTARFTKVAIFAADTVTRLAERAALKLDWGKSAAFVDLYLVKLGGEDEPTDDEEAAALSKQHLGVGWPLSRAQIASGAWVVAKMLLGAPLPAQALGSSAASVGRDAAASPSSSQRIRGEARELRAAVAAAFDAAGAAAVVSRISLGAAELPVWAHSVVEPERSRLRFHRLISDARTADFHATVDGSGNDVVRPAVGDEEVKGMSFFVVLSDDPAVIAAAHAFMHPTMRHRGCCVRSLDAVPENTALLLDSVKVASDGGLPIIVHASLVPTATMYVGEFIVGLQRQAAAVCQMEARADVDDEAAFDDDAAFEGGDGGESWEGEHEDDGEGEDGDDGDSDGEGEGNGEGEGEGEGESKGRGRG